MKSSLLISVVNIADIAVRSALTQLINYLKAQPRFEVMQMDAPYKPPLYLRLSAEPTGGIACVRIRQLPDLETIVAHTNTVVFTWEGQQSRARIDAIGGMIPGADITYRYNFVAMGTS